MPEHTRLEVYQTSGLVPLFYHADAATALGIAGACVVEVTNRGPEAYEVFTALAKQRPCVLGVGSIYDAPTAARKGQTP
jgi:2-keto-3-deoxy-6-phosphogluconate aldolase